MPELLRRSSRRIRSRLGAGLGVLALLALPLPALAASDILFVLDSSNSMWGQVDEVAKIETARGVLGGLVSQLPSDTRVGLLVYGHRDPEGCDDIELVAPLAPVGEGALETALAGVQPKGRTPIAGALARSADAFPPAEGRGRNVVLISDGVETCDGDPCGAARALAASGVDVRVHVVGFDLNEEERRELECISREGGGAYFPADGTAGFAQAVAKVVEVAQAPTPEPEPEPPQAEVVFEDEFEGAGLGAAWQVLSPDPDAYLVDGGELLRVATGPAGFGTSGATNLMLLDQPVPKGDFALRARLHAEYATGQEAFWLGLYEDDQNFVAARLFVILQRHWKRIGLDVRRRSGGEDSSFRLVARGIGCGHCSKTASFEDFVDMTDGPMTLSLVREGRKIFARLAIEGQVGEDGEPVVHETKPLSLLRISGTPAVAFEQRAETDGDTLLFVDRVEIVAGEE